MTTTETVFPTTKKFTWLAFDLPDPVAVRPPPPILLFQHPQDKAALVSLSTVKEILPGKGLSPLTSEL